MNIKYNFVSVIPVLAGSEEAARRKAFCKIRNESRKFTLPYEVRV